VRERAKRIEMVSRDLQQQLNRAPTPDEVAHALDIDRDTYWQWRGDAESTAAVSIDVRVPGEERDGISLAERIADTESAPPDAEILAAERGVLLRQAIRELPEQQRTVLALSFYEELSHRQIAEVLHVTESRISQIRSAALRALKIRMGDA
jgi:RNA polymerase sigma factor for flagellar operon FliA